MSINICLFVNRIGSASRCLQVRLDLEVVAETAAMTDATIAEDRNEAAEEDAGKTKLL
jgi:hypothetical protein